jgi:hypothetical protein
MNSKRLVVLLPVAALLLSSGLSPAQPGAAGKDAYQRKDRAGERRQQREDRGEQRERRNERAEDRKDRAESRRERRRERARELRALYGGLLANQAVLVELRIHARRMAKLRALRRVAEREGKTALLPRIDKLIEKEQARHRRHMDALKSRDAAAPAPSASYRGAR